MRLSNLKTATKAGNTEKNSQLQLYPQLSPSRKHLLGRRNGVAYGSCANGLVEVAPFRAGSHARTRMSLWNVADVAELCDSYFAETQQILCLIIQVACQRSFSVGLSTYQHRWLSLTLSEKRGCAVQYAIELNSSTSSLGSSIHGCFSARRESIVI
jgi:hypothetical protein